jgi:DNA-binding IscR family transcriptional regulator
MRRTRGACGPDLGYLVSELCGWARESSGRCTAARSWQRCARGEALPAARLAEFHGAPGAYLAKHLQALASAGILESVQGPAGAIAWPGRRRQITILDVVDAVEGDEPAFRCTEIRQRGPAAGPPDAYPRRCGIALAFDAADAAWRSELAAHTVADLLAGVLRGLHPEVADQDGHLDPGGALMKIFVAGGTGVIGRRAVARLVAAGHEVTAIARGPDKAQLVRSLGPRRSPSTCSTERRWPPRCPATRRS